MKAGNKAMLALIALTTIPSVANAQAARPQHVQFAAPGAARAASREAYTPPIFGVATSFGSVRDLGYNSIDRVKSQMDGIGANSYRDSLPWAAFRVRRDKTLELAQERRIMDFLPAAGRRPMLILGATPEKVAATGMPFNDVQLGRFADYVKQTVQLTRKYDPIYEVWNEYNMRVGFEKPAPHLTDEGAPSDIRAAVHYAKLAGIGVRAVKQANPDAKVLVGAAGFDPDWKWTLAVVRNGALEGADGLSVHLYNKCSPIDLRSATDMIDRVESLQATLKKMRGGKVTPIYVSEFGWSTVRPNTRCGVPEDRQGYNVAQYILRSATLPWLKGSWLYELKDRGGQPRWIEENFGIYRFDDRPKPAACFVREARKIVALAKSVDLERPRPGVFVMRAVLPDRQIAAIWTDRVAPTGRFKLAGQPRSARIMCGDAVNTDGGVALSNAPLIVEYSLQQPVSVTIAG